MALYKKLDNPNHELDNIKQNKKQIGQEVSSSKHDHFF